MNLLHSVASWYFKREISRIEQVTTRPVETQEAVFRYLMQEARDTEFGKTHDFAGVQQPEDLKKRLPVQDYDTLKPWIERVMNGEQNLLWPSTISVWDSGRWMSSRFSRRKPALEGRSSMSYPLTCTLK